MASSSHDFNGINVFEYRSLSQPREIETPWENETHTAKIGSGKVTHGLLKRVEVKDKESFVQFIPKIRDNEGDAKSPFKIHISIHPDDMAKAWEILFPELMKPPTLHFKVARLETIHQVRTKLLDNEANLGERTRNINEYIKQTVADLGRLEDGMQITIYPSKNNIKQLQKRLVLFENLLAEKGIRPGIVHDSDKQLGLYCSTRQEMRFNPETKVFEDYLSYEKAPLYKDPQEKDLFSSMKLPASLASIPWSQCDFQMLLEQAKLRVDKCRRLYEEYQRLSPKKLIETINPDDLKKSKHTAELAYDVMRENFARWREIIKSMSAEEYSEASKNTFFRKFERRVNHEWEEKPKYSAMARFFSTSRSPIQELKSSPSNSEDKPASSHPSSSKP